MVGLGLFVCLFSVVSMFSSSVVSRTGALALGLKHTMQEECGYAKLCSQFCETGKTETAQKKTLSLILGADKFCIKMWTVFLEPSNQ